MVSAKICNNLGGLFVDTSTHLMDYFRKVSRDEIQTIVALGSKYYFNEEYKDVD